MKPGTRATSVVVFTAAVLPVDSRYCSTVCFTGKASSTFGGGGGTNLLLSPQAARTNVAASERAAAERVRDEYATRRGGTTNRIKRRNGKSQSMANRRESLLKYEITVGYPRCSVQILTARVRRDRSIPRRQARQA